jgi:hypothetical protein
MGLGKKIKKVVHKVVGGPVSLSNPHITGGVAGAVLGGAAMGGVGSALGAAAGPEVVKALTPAPYPGLEDGNGQADYDRIRAEYGALADRYTSDATSYRDKLASSLANTGQETFKMANPYILQDLNARGLFTSPTAVSQGQSEALKEIALGNQQQLSGFDTDVFNNVQNIRATGTGASLQRLFDVQDQDREQRLATYLARRQSRDSLVSSLLGGAATLGGAYLTAGASLPATAAASRRRNVTSNDSSYFDGLA